MLIYFICATLCAVLFQYFSPFFYAVGASGIGSKTFVAAKVLLFFEIYKKFCSFDAELIVLGVWSKFLKA